ncbi:MAG: hypothetical protein INF05_06810, partial [Methylobacterium sp.]|nr:hypothetical protein [Methylobacterium sp.]
MSKLPNVLRIVSAPHGGFIVQNDDFKPLVAFTSPVDLIGWLSRNLMPDAAATLSGRPQVEAKPSSEPEKRASTADLDQ